MPRCYCARPSPPTLGRHLLRKIVCSWLSTGCDVVRLSLRHQRPGEDRAHGPPWNRADTMVRRALASHWPCSDRHRESESDVSPLRRRTGRVLDLPSGSLLYSNWRPRKASPRPNPRCLEMPWERGDFCEDVTVHGGPAMEMRALLLSA